MNRNFRSFPAFSIAPRWARTTNLRFRRPMLYPIELEVHVHPPLDFIRSYDAERRLALPFRTFRHFWLSGEFGYYGEKDWSTQG
jgi:hypothetical protein